MATEIAACEVWSCPYNEQSLCKRAFITLDEAGTCDLKATQYPIPEPEK